ncbi:MAG: hypothetical protein JWQ04_3576 [Pedosphaera sp.]|nr:hypothetical protein [Pedosphaera sp.]
MFIFAVLSLVGLLKKDRQMAIAAGCGFFVYLAIWAVFRHFRKPN